MTIAVAGGDKRSIIAGEMLSKAGYKCKAFGFDDKIRVANGIEYFSNPKDALFQANAVILPLPCEKNGFLNAPFSKTQITLDEIFDFCSDETLFVGGKLDETKPNRIDYSKREDFLTNNAIPTAEGAIALAMKETECTINESNIVVLGFGRIGNYLSFKLDALGARVTVAARSLKIRAQVNAFGMNAVGFDELEAPLYNADLVINTVPFKVIGKPQLECIKPNVAIIDLASLPGGADEEECRAHGRKLLRALSLPGKVAPQTAGKIVFDSVLSILTEWGITP